MFEKVNPSHPDKVADRIAGAIVDYAYQESENPHIAVEVLLGHDNGLIIIEQDVWDNKDHYKLVAYIREKIIPRLVSGKPYRDISIKITQQDKYLCGAQKKESVCGDNGIFRGCPVDWEEEALTNVVGLMYEMCPFDGKYLFYDDENDLPEMCICQSNMTERLANVAIEHAMKETKWGSCVHRMLINPLGDWTGGLDVDSGATNRKLGSDMGKSATGGGLHGKDLSKADVTLNILCHKYAQQYNAETECACKIGDEEICIKVKLSEDETKYINKKYEQCIAEALSYINNCGGFEKFAEWGLIRPCKQ